MELKLLEIENSEIEVRSFKFCYYNLTSGAGHLTDTDDSNEIFSNGHTARGILVYVLRNLLNYGDNKKSWTVEIKDNGALVLSNRSKKYLFHAVKNKEEIEREIEKYQDLNIPHHFFAVLEQFKTSQTVEFYKFS